MTVGLGESTRRPRRVGVWVAVIAVLVLVTLARIWMIDHLRDQGYFLKYTEFADRILAGHIPADRVADVSPAYLWLTVVLRWSGLALKPIRTLQIIALSVAALLCGVAAKQLAGWPAAIAAAILILGNRAALVIATELEPETLILLLTSAAILAAVAWQQGSRRAPWILGLLVGLSAVARPVALGTIVLLVAWALLRRTGRHEEEARGARVRAAVQVLVAAAVPIVIVLVVNRAITGHFIIMQPGTHVYEGNNPLATAAAGVMPQVVADLNVSTTEPDYLHVAYRIVAARATGGPVDPRLSNEFWSAKAFAYMREYPLDALDLFFWKAVLAVHHYDVYDLITTRSKASELSRFPALPFGLAFVLTIAALVLHRRRGDLVVVVLFAVATLAALVAFNVSARQRNALLAPFAVIGGVAVAELVALARARSERALLAFGGIVVVTPMLGIEGPPMREDAYNWWAALQSSGMVEGAKEARDRGDRPRAAMLAANASILRTDDPPLVSAATLRPVALATASRTDEPPMLFDAAIALQKAGAWRESEATLQSILDYRPRREHRAVSSVAYYRARAALRLTRDVATARSLLERAQKEAPGDPDILALSSLLGDGDAMRLLDAMHDPFTRDFALAQAWSDLGRPDRADAILASLEKRIPEWSRPGRTRQR